jgi:hypothetical protein
VTLGAAVAGLAACALYLPHLGTGFASEDFLILARLSRQGLVTTLREELVSPWLGLVAVGFWRPVSTFLLGLELALFGLEPARFHAAHLVVHGFNAWLVATIVTKVTNARWGTPGARPDATRAPGWIGIAAAALFAIHPFHPSAVLFTGAFATLFGATFSLLATSCFLAARSPADGAGSDARAKARRLDLSALACFVLALGCYEASIVLPAALAVLVVLWPSPSSNAGEPTIRTTAPLRRTVPYFLIAVLYLVARALVLGASIGGYAAFRERWLGAPMTLLGDFVSAVGRIVHPWFDAGNRGVWVWLIGAVAAFVAVTLGSTRRSRAAIAAVTTTALFLAPFSFVGLVPANGRYAYLAIAGVVLAVCSLGAAIAARWPRTGARIVAIATIAVAIDWLVPLLRILPAYDAATERVSALRADLIGVSALHEKDDVVLLVDDPPDFIKGDAGEPIAKVLQYGLAESVRPPFGPALRAPVPLPSAVGSTARAALDALPGTTRHRWDGNAERLMPVAAEPPSMPRNLEVDSYDPSTGRLEATCGRCDSTTRAVLLTAALPIVIAPVDEPASGRVGFDVPSDLLRGLGRLADGDAFLWVEQPAALSPIVRFALDGDVARNLAEAAAKIRRDRDSAQTDREDDR